MILSVKNLFKVQSLGTVYCSSNWFVQSAFKGSIVVYVTIVISSIHVYEFTFVYCILKYLNNYCIVYVCWILSMSTYSEYYVCMCIVVAMAAYTHRSPSFCMRWFSGSWHQECSSHHTNPEFPPATNAEWPPASPWPHVPSTPSRCVIFDSRKKIS